MNKLTLLHDHGTGEKHLVRDDALGFDDYAQVLAEAVKHNQGPFTIGIFGEWGTGKTSLMRMVKEKLSEKQDQDSIFPVWVNAWRFEKEEHPIVPIIATILTDLKKSSGFYEPKAKGQEDKYPDVSLIATILNGFKKYAGFDKPKAKGQEDDPRPKLLNTLRDIARCFAIKAEVGVPSFGKVSGEVDLSKLKEDKYQPPHLLEDSIYYNAFQELSKIKLEDQTKIVVIIDDLDRCFPNMAIKILETIKLILWHPGFIFIIGVSNEVIEGYLTHRYQKRFGLADFNGSQYLDKIIQLPFTIPPIINPERIESFIRNLLGDIHEEYKDVLEEIVEITGPMLSYNPRSIIRFINNLIIYKNIGDLILDRESKGLGSENLVPISFYAVSEILRKRFPNVYTILSRSKGICKTLLDYVEDFDKKYQEIPEELESTDLKTILDEVKNKTDLRNLLFVNDIGKEWLKDERSRTKAIDLYMSLLVITRKDVPLKIVTWRAPHKDEQYNGKKMYRVDVFIDAKDNILDLISSVTYYLHSSYPNSKQVKTDRDSKFKLKELAWGSTILQASVKIKDRPEPIKVEGHIELVDRPKPVSPSIPD